MKVLIRQPAGLGDIFFLMKIGIEYHKQGYEVIWPIEPHFMFLNSYIQAPFKFISLADSFEHKDLFINRDVNKKIIRDTLYLPLQDSSLTYGEPVMFSKYHMAEVSIDNYIDYFNFSRNTQQENRLLSTLDIIEGVSQFTFTNRIYASLPHELHYPMEFNISNRRLPVIELKVMLNYTLFDWCKVFELASEIHTVGTSLTFILEKLKLSALPITMYKRPGAKLSNFEPEKALFTKNNWTFNTQDR